MGCTATAYTIERNDAAFIKNVKNTHNHSSKLVKKRVKVAEQEAVENAVRNPTLTCRTVMAELANTLQTDSMAAASSMSRMSTIKQRIHRGRYIIYCTGEAKLSTSANDILNMNDQYKHLDSLELFLVRAKRVPTDSDNVVLIFMSDFGRHIMKNSETWSSDGTFSTVPRDFLQIYVVFGLSHDKLFPCAYMLLPNKSASLCEYALETLKLELQYTSPTINIDFEQAVIK